MKKFVGFMTCILVISYYAASPYITQLLNCTERSEGVVIELYVSHHGNQREYFPVIEFEVDGEKVIRRYDVSDGTYQVGMLFP